MPARSMVAQLPPDIREWLEGELVRRGFGDYLDVTRELNDVLEEKGLEITISKSSLHRYGQQLEERIDALRKTTQVARTVVNEVGDDEGALSDALVRVVQNKLFHLVMDLEADPDKTNIVKVGHVIADLTRASVQQKKLMQEVRAKVATVAEEIADDIQSAGLSAETADEIRRKILGIEPPK